MVILRFLPFLLFATFFSACARHSGGDSYPGFPETSSPVTRKEVYRKYPPLRSPAISSHFSLTASGWGGIETYELDSSHTLFAFVTYPIPKSKMRSIESLLATSMPMPRQSPADLFSGVTIRIKRDAAERGMKPDGNARGHMGARDATTPSPDPAPLGGWANRPQTTKAK